jgi:hypothetical protein
MPCSSSRSPARRPCNSRRAQGSRPLAGAAGAAAAWQLQSGGTWDCTHAPEVGALTSKVTSKAPPGGRPSSSRTWRWKHSAAPGPGRTRSLCTWPAPGGKVGGQQAPAAQLGHHHHVADAQADSAAPQPAPPL